MITACRRWGGPARYRDGQPRNTDRQEIFAHLLYARGSIRKVIWRLKGCWMSLFCQAAAPPWVSRRPPQINIPHSPFVWGCARGEPKLKQAWSEPGSKQAPVVGEQGPTAHRPHCPRNACLGRRRTCKSLHVKSPSLRDRHCVRATAGLWEVALPEPLGPRQTPTSRPLRPLCCCSAFTVHLQTLPDSLDILDVGIGPEHGR